MPFLHADPALNDSPTNLLVRNAFLIFRLVFLALSFTFTFLSLIFASWNVNSTLSVGHSVPSTSIFIIFQSCLVFFCVALALVDLFNPRAEASRVLLECVWSGVLSMCHLGAAISTTVNGPSLACKVTSDWTVCASASLLVPVTWLNSVVSLAYFFTLFITTMAHKTLYPDIWMRTVYSINWFGQPPESPSSEKVVQDFLGCSPCLDDPYFDHYDDIGSTAMRKKNYRIRDSVEEAIPWASAPIRRGIDPPFVRPGQLSSRSSPSLPPRLDLPSYPNRSVGTIGSAGSRYLEKFRESSVLSRTETPAQYTTHYLSHKDSFPISVADLDQPIPLPRRSEWIKADK